MLCPVCRGRGHHFHMPRRQPSWIVCWPCRGSGVVGGDGRPARLPIARAQASFLKPLPQDSQADDASRD